MITSSIELITQEKARELLEFSKQQGFMNRKISRVQLQKYINDMKSNNWKTTGQGITISDEGVLIDGYHRLNAIVMSGCSIPMIVVRGAKKEVFKYLDIGLNRSVQTIAFLSGYTKNTSNIVSVAIALYILFRYQQNGILRFDNNVIVNTPLQILSKERVYKRIEQCLHIYKDEIEKGILCAGHCKMTAKTSFIVCYVLFSFINKEKAEYFFKKLERGDNLNSDDPIFLLREKLQELRIEFKTTKYLESYVRYTYYKYITTAWNIYYNNAKRKTLQVKKDEQLVVAGLNEYEFAKTILSPEELAKVFPEVQSFIIEN